MHSLFATPLLLGVLSACACGATSNRSDAVVDSPVGTLNAPAPTNVEKKCVPMQVHLGAKFVGRSEAHTSWRREHVAPLKVEPPAAVLEDMSKRGENVIATYISICADSSGKENYRDIRRTRYESFNRLVLARSEELDVSAIMLPSFQMNCFDWFVVWELEKNLCSSM